MKLKLALVVALLVYLVGYSAYWGIAPASSLVLWVSANPLLALLTFSLLMLLITTLVAYVFGKEREVKILAALTLLVFVALPFSSFITLSYSSKFIKVVELKKLPNLYGVYRLIPLETAYDYAADRLQIPTHTIYFSESYVYYINTTPVYNWLVEPEGLNVFLYGPKGAVFVYGNRYPPKVFLVRQALTWGLHNVKLTPLFPDTLAFELTLRGAFGKKLIFDDTAEVLKNGEIVIYVPLVSYEVDFPGSFPVVKGYYEVFPNGTIKFVKPSEARPVPALPEEVAREWVERLRFADWTQALFFHNTFIIRNVGTNPQPYLLLDKNGNLWWVFVAEPPGNTYAAYKVIMFKANSVKPVAYIYTFEKPQIGVSKVKSYVMRAHPNWNWGTLKIQEPMPVILNNTIYWKTAVTTLDGRGLISVEFLNARTGQVISVPVKGNVTAKEILNRLRTSQLTKEGSNKLEEIIKLINKIEKDLEQLKRLLSELK